MPLRGENAHADPALPGVRWSKLPGLDWRLILKKTAQPAAGGVMQTMSMRDFLSTWGKKAAVPVPIMIGALILFYMVSNAKDLEKKPPHELARTLRVIEVERMPVVPRALAFGTAQAAQVWTAVAEVSGRVIEVHEDLKAGAFLRAGETVLKIDPYENELAVAELQAEIAETQAQVDELETQAANDRVALSIEQASLDLAEADLEKVRSLIQQNDAADTEVRAQKRAVLAQRQKVQNLEKSLSLVPKRRASLEASLAVREARMEQAQYDLSKTVIKAPFDCRLNQVDIEVGQFLGRGQALFEADGADAVEVEAQVPLDRGRQLIRRENAEPLRGIPDMDELRRRLGIQAIVRTHIGDFSTSWQARFVRVREQVDPMTRTLGVVVAVDQPYAKAIPGERPPLVKNTFCEVEFFGDPIPDLLVLPRSAVDGGEVFVLDKDNRLARQAVEVYFTQGAFVTLRDGLQPGQRVVVSDPHPAIDGMLVDPVRDDELMAELKRDASAEGTLP